MALSNWDTLAVNQDAKPSQGEFVSPLGIHVEVYKNWLYIRDKHGWQEGGKFGEPTVMEVFEGNLTYKDAHILAFRGPQSGVYAFIWSSKYKEYFKGMVGIGVYGFDDEKWVGVKKSSITWLKNKIVEVQSDIERLFDIPEELRSLNLDNAPRFNQGDAYFSDKVGVSIQATKLEEAEEPTLMKLIKS